MVAFDLVGFSPCRRDPSLLQHELNALEGRMLTIYISNGGDTDHSTSSL